MKKNHLFALSLISLVGVLATACGGFNGDITPSSPETSDTSSNLDSTPESGEITIAKLIEIAKAAGTTNSAEAYTVKAKIKTILNSTFGEMEIEDETGSMYVYGAYTAKDEALSQIGAAVGDSITIKGKVRMYGDKPGFASSTILEHSHEVAPTRTVTIAEAIAIAKAAGETYTEESYRITATIKTVSNATYGEMYITDETGELYIYGLYGEDGTTYDKLADKPVKGDTITLEGHVHVFKDTPEMGKATLISFEHNAPQIKPEDYKSATIAEARAAKAEELVKVTGVVAAININASKSPCGFLLVDDTASIYVYDIDAVGQVAIGNKVTLAAEKAYFISSSEEGNAKKWGYIGANQLTSVTILENDKGNHSYNQSVAETTTVKAIMDTPVSEDITGKLFKADALIKYAEGAGFNNVYIDDIDGKTGSYVYTLCNGSDLDWAIPLSGKVCETYFVALNAKSTATGCQWRFLPVTVTDKNFKFDTKNAAQYILDYEVDSQFDKKYTADPALELVTSVSSELLGITNATVAYTSSDEEVFNIASEGGKSILHTGTKYGKAEITITATYAGISASKKIALEYAEPKSFETITVAQAIAAEVNKEIYVEGVVTGSYTNKYGFFITDETGTIAVLPTDGQTTSDALRIGDKVIVSGKRATYKKDEAATGYVGQIQIENAVVEDNSHGDNIPSESAYVTDKTASEIIALSNDGNTMQTKMYRAQFYVNVVESAYSTNLYLLPSEGSAEKITCYSSSASQYNWLIDAFKNKIVTIDLMLVNPNSKNYWRALPVRATDGTTTVWNTLYCQAPTF